MSISLGLMLQILYFIFNMQTQSFRIGFDPPPHLILLLILHTSQVRVLRYNWKRKKKKVKLLTPVQLFATPWTVACQAPPPMEFSRLEYWSGLPFPSLGDLPSPGIEPRSPTLQADSLPSEPPGKPDTSRGRLESREGDQQREFYLVCAPGWLLNGLVLNVFLSRDLEGRHLILNLTSDDPKAFPEST